MSYCGCEGPVAVSEDGDCRRCGRVVEFVYAFRNGGELRAVERLAEGEEVDAGQCDACGSFTEAGEPGAGFLVGAVGRCGWEARCGCCGAARPVSLHPAPEVVF